MTADHIPQPNFDVGVFSRYAFVISAALAGISALVFLVALLTTIF